MPIDYALLTDLYEITMAQGYRDSGHENTEACFHMYFRDTPFKGGYAIACGMAQLADMVDTYAFSGEDIDYLSKIPAPGGGALFAADYINDLDFGSVEYEPVFTDNNTALYQFKVPYSPVVLYRFYSSLRSGSADKISVQHLEQLFVSLSLSLRGAVTATSLSADFRDLIPLDASLWEVLSKYTYTERCAFRVSHRKPWIAKHTSLANLLGCIRGEIDFDSLNTAPSERHVDSFFGGKDAALANLDLSRTKLWLEHDLTCLIEETYRRYYA